MKNELDSKEVEFGTIDLSDVPTYQVESTDTPERRSLGGDEGGIFNDPRE